MAPFIHAFTMPTLTLLLQRPRGGHTALWMFAVPRQYPTRHMARAIALACSPSATDMHTCWRPAPPKQAQALTLTSQERP